MKKLIEKYGVVMVVISFTLFFATMTIINVNNNRLALKSYKKEQYRDSVLFVQDSINNEEYLKAIK